jgi:hypothetical protein
VALNGFRWVLVLVLSVYFVGDARFCGDYFLVFGWDG